MKENTSKLFSFDSDAILGTVRKTGKTARDVIEGIAREQIAGETKFVDLSSKQFDMFVDSENIEDMIKANREWFSGTVEILKEHAGNSFKIVQDAAGKFISSEDSPVKGVMKRAESAVAKTTSYVEEAAA